MKTLKMDVTNVFKQVIPEGSRVRIIQEDEGDIYVIPLDTDLRGAWVKKEDVQ